MIKINVESISVFAYIKDKATWTTNLICGDDIPIVKLIDTNWKDFKDPIVGTLIPNFFLAYFGQDLPHGDLSNEEIMAKLACLDQVMNFGLIQPKLRLNMLTTSLPSWMRSRRPR